MKAKIVYFGDPLCSWCYGFAPEISQVKERFGESMGFQLVMGGLRPHGTERIVEMQSFLRHHWEEVGNRSGQPFQFDMLENADFVYDTEPPSRAVVAIRQLAPQHEFDFFKQVQRLFYYDNKDTGMAENYFSLLDAIDVKPEEFVEAFEDDMIRKKTQQDFMFSQNAGIRGFPTTVLKVEQDYYLLAHGYMEATVIGERIEKIISGDALIA